MNKGLLLGVMLLPSWGGAQVLTQCYLENIAKAPEAAVCIAKIRGAGKIVTEGDVFMCNIKMGLLIPVKCEDTRER